MKVSVEEALRRGWVSPADVAPVAAQNKGRRRGKSEIEGDEQVELVKQFRALYPELGHLLIHIPNGGSRKNAFEGWRLKEQGVRAGVSDLLLPVAKGGYFGLWIEFKATPPNDADVSDKQEEWISLMKQQGYRAEACLGVAAALAVLAEYMSKPATTALIQNNDMA